METKALKNASDLAAPWLNYIQDQLCKVCFYSGQQKNKSSFNVLSKACAKKGSVIFILSSSFMKRLNENSKILCTYSWIFWKSKWAQQTYTFLIFSSTCLENHTFLAPFLTSKMYLLYFSKGLLGYYWLNHGSCRNFKS